MLAIDTPSKIGKKKNIGSKFQHVAKMINLKGFLKRISLSYLVYNQIWLNLLMNDCQFWLHDKIDKKEKKRKEKKRETEKQKTKHQFQQVGKI